MNSFHTSLCYIKRETTTKSVQTHDVHCLSKWHVDISFEKNYFFFFSFACWVARNNADQYRERWRERWKRKKNFTVKFNLLFYIHNEKWTEPNKIKAKKSQNKRMNMDKSIKNHKSCYKTRKHANEELNRPTTIKRKIQKTEYINSWRLFTNEKIAFRGKHFHFYFVAYHDWRTVRSK